MRNLLQIFGLVVFLAGLTACTDEDDPLSPVMVNFTNPTMAINQANASAEVEITFSRTMARAGELLIDLNNGNLNYGEEQDFYTSPAAENNTIRLPFAQGAESISFSVFSGTGLNIQEDQEISFLLDATEGAYEIGQNQELTLVFSENFIAPSGSLALDAGDEFNHQVYVDLSKLNQTRVNVHSWDLGLYNEAGEFRVRLNSGAALMARPLDKYSLTEVDAQDTVGFAYEMQVPPPNFDPSIGAAAWVDSPDGNLESTAFGDISTTAAENPVFIIKRNGGRNWKKVRVLRNGEGYMLEYADIASESFNTLEIEKDANYHFTYVELGQGVVEAAPARDRWDLMYGTFTELLNLGGPGMDIPYLYKDFIVLNRNTEVAMVMTEDVAYADFGTADLAGITFAAEQDALGETWRSGGGPTSGPALREDRFFLIKDSSGSVYKLLFNRLTNAEGKRGTPDFQFALVQ